MRFTIQAAPFLDGLKSVQARARANSIELLRHIRFDVVDDKLTLLGHDTASSSQAFLSVGSATDGTCAVPADAIVRLIGSLPKEAHVAIERQDYQITIKVGRSRYKLNVLLSDDFPGALPCDDGESVDLSGADVRQLFARPRAVLDPKDARLQMQGAYLHAVDGKLASAAYGNFHFVRFMSETAMPSLVGVIVPAAAMDEIERMGAGRLTVSDRSIAYETEGRRFCSKLIDANYFDYMRAVPPTGAYVEVDRAEMLEAVKRLSLLSATESEIHLAFGSGEVIASIAGAGEGVETVAASGEVGDGILIAITPSQIVAGLGLPAGEVVQLHVEPGKLYIRIVDPFEPSAVLAEATRLPKNVRAAA